MQQLIYFFIKNKTTFLFIVLLVCGMTLTFRSNYYHQSKFLNSANFISGNIYETLNEGSSFLELKSQNQLLAEENRSLRQQLLHNNTEAVSEESIGFSKECFDVMLGRVVKNSIRLSKNYLTINIGSKQGIAQDMGVVSSKGVVGIVERTSNNFATVQSVLNTRSLLNVKLKKSNHFGSLRWDGKEVNIVQLSDIPKVAPLSVGDTIVTGGMSSIFPKDIPVGVVKNFEINEYEKAYNINVELFTDMSNVEYIYVLDNVQKEEIQTLESKEEKDD